MPDRIVSSVRALVSWRSVVAATLLLMLLGGALSAGAGLADGYANGPLLGAEQDLIQRGLVQRSLMSQGLMSQGLAQQDLAQQDLVQQDLTQQGSKLLAGESGEVHFGQSVALSADGNTALVGAPTGNGGAGAVWVFTRMGSTWTQQAELTPSSGEEIGNGGFGFSLALSSDGATALIGAPGDNGGVGGAWAFTRSEGGVWNQQGSKLTGADESGASELGWSVALSKDGTTALIGAPGDSGKVGAAWAFMRSTEGSWTQQCEKLTGSGEEGEGQFGHSVALSKDGATALIGAPDDSGKVGAAWAFTSSEGVWSQQGGKLTGGGESGEGEFGRSVALSFHGDTALVGATADNTGVGAAWAFTRSEAGAWTQQGEKLTANSAEESENGEFGSSAALSSDGATALIGAPGDSGKVGAAWMFTSSEGVWSQQGGKLTGGGESGEGEFGSSVALSSDGNTALAGGPADDSGAGAAWAFVNPPTVASVSPNKGPEAGGTSVTITGANFNEATAVTFGSSEATSFEVTSPTSITAVSPAGAGTVDLGVSTSGGTSVSGLGDLFSYLSLPTISNVSPNVGPTAGGTRVTITGTNLSEVTAVEFGSTSAQVMADSETSITAIAPAGTGTVEVTVSTAGGRSATGPADKFSYVSPPTITGVSPSAGPLVAGTSVTIAGTNLGEASAVQFGATNAVSFKVSSGTSITAIAPAGMGGTVDVTVSTPGGTSATGVADRFSYVPLPTVTSVSPNIGALAGGTLVTIAGANFTAGTTVKFGLTDATGVKVSSETSITAIAPAGVGTVDVTVSTPGGTSATGAADKFSYPGPPTIEVEEPSAIGQTLAILQASLNPNGGVITQCYFHYERVVPTPQEIPVITPCVGLPISGNKPMPVSALAGAEEGLSAATNYRYSIEVINSFGETAFRGLPEGEQLQFKTLPGPEVVTEGASSITQSSATLNAMVNPNGGKVSSCEFEYGTSEAYGSKPVPCESLPGAGTEKVPVSAKLQGLSLNTQYFFRVVATNPGGTSKDTDGRMFMTLPNPPVVVTAAASSTTQTSATLNGTVNPSGGTVSACHFEYGTSTSYGTSIPCSSLPGSGTGAVAVSASSGSLSPNTTYYFRIVATNPGGTSTDILKAQMFKTLPERPTVVTAAASSTTQTSATLNGTVNPSGGTVSACHFEYGTSTSYGASIPCSSLPGSGTGAVAVSTSLGSLSADTTYYFRIVATNPGGTSSGSDQSFTTPSVQSTTGTPLATTKAIETPTPSTISKVPVATCRVSLASMSVMAQAGGMAAIKLIWTGTATGTCSGKLTLTVRAAGKGKRPKPTLIGAGAFSLPPGKIGIVKLKIDEAGRALLDAGHGRLSASLAILKLFPGPSQAQTATIHLARAATSSNKHEN